MKKYQKIFDNQYLDNCNMTDDNLLNFANMNDLY